MRRTNQVVNARAALQLLNKAIARSLANPELRERFQKSGIVPSPSTPEEVRKRYADWMVIFGKIAKSTTSA